MKIYNVKVNGKEYKVELESVSEVNSPIKEEKKEVVSSNGSNEVLSPISGKVLKVNVNVGDKVNKGDTLCVIEAMKLENEVKSAYSGTVKEVKVSKGSDCQNKDVLFVIG